MCIAGALRASLEIWRSKHDVFQIYSPCVCQVMEGTGSVVHTVGQIKDNVFVLMETKTDKRPTRYPKPRQCYRYVNDDTRVTINLILESHYCNRYCIIQLSYVFRDLIQTLVSTNHEHNGVFNALKFCSQEGMEWRK